MCETGGKAGDQGDERHYQQCPERDKDHKVDPRERYRIAKAFISPIVRAHDCGKRLSTGFGRTRNTRVCLPYAARPNTMMAKSTCTMRRMKMILGAIM